jgi:hypothetical protein
MKTEDLIKQILSTAKMARASGQSVKIDAMLPTVSVISEEGDEYYFQEHEATRLIEDAEATIKGLGELAEESVSVEDYLLYSAQGW